MKLYELSTEGKVLGHTSDYDKAIKRAKHLAKWKRKTVSVREYILNCSISIEYQAPCTSTK